MFTGLITDIGKVVQVAQQGDLRARIACGYDVAGIAMGASVACDGVCLTAVATGLSGSPSGGPAGEPEPRGWFEVEISAETVARTTLSGWAPGSRVNLERSLRLGDELGGHIVSGHVDGVAQVTAVREVDGSTRFTIHCDRSLGRFIAPKGSVALNGTSLTVNDVRDEGGATVFEVNLIPHSKAVTTWGQTAVGDRLNLEVDTMARYVARLQAAG